MLLPLSKTLRLITPNVLCDRKAVLRLMRWRIKNQHFYTTQPKVTERSFRHWLRKYVFSLPKLLFWVTDEEGSAIGHIGIRFWEKYCEIDNVSRGEKQGKGRMGEALDVLVHWIQDNTTYEEISLRVISSNVHAIDFYQKHGFVSVRKTVIHKDSPLRFLKMKYEH